MAKRDLSAAIKNRVETAKAAREEEQTVDFFCEELLGMSVVRPEICRMKIALDKVHPFRVENIGFKPYDEESLRELAKSIDEDGLFDAIKVRKDAEGFEILAGHNRARACRLLGWQEIPADVYDIDDARAIIIATATNLKHRQTLLPSERAFAYRALLEAKRRQGKRTDLDNDPEKGTVTRDKVAAIFEVDRNIIQKFVRFTYLIPALLDAVDEKRINQSCAELISFYSEAVQTYMYERLESNGWKLSCAVMNYIKRESVAEEATPEDIKDLWDKAESVSKEKLIHSAKISFSRKRFAPYLEQLGGEDKLAEEFEAFLRAKLQQSNP